MDNLIYNRFLVFEISRIFILNDVARYNKVRFYYRYILKYKIVANFFMQSKIQQMAIWLSVCCEYKMKSYNYNICT